MNYKYNAKKYFTLPFIITFIFWFIGAWFSYRQNEQSFYMIFMLLGLITPFVLSVVMIKNTGNKDLKKKFYYRLRSLRLINLKMIPILLFLMPVSVIISIVISTTFFHGSTDQFILSEEFSFSTGFVPVLLLLFLAATFEELGWRGYAFDSLQERFGNTLASIYFSILWSLWHLPLIIVKDSYQFEILQQNPWYAVNFFLSIIPMGMIVSWVCIRNNKSILAAVLFHFIINISQEMFNITQQTKCIQTSVIFAMAIAVILVDSKVFYPTLGKKIKKN